MNATLQEADTLLTILSRLKEYGDNNPHRIGAIEAAACILTGKTPSNLYACNVIEGMAYRIREDRHSRAW